MLILWDLGTNATVRLGRHPDARMVVEIGRKARRLRINLQGKIPVEYRVVAALILCRLRSQPRKSYDDCEQEDYERTKGALCDVDHGVGSWRECSVFRSGLLQENL
jgi:hypothetical protein